MSRFSDKGSEFAQKHATTLERVGEVFKALGGVIPVAGAAMNVLGVIFGYVGTSGRTQAEEAKKIQERMETLMNQLEKTADIIQSFDEKQRKVSGLPAEVKTSYQAILDWAEAIRLRQQPRDLVQKLDDRIQRLESAIKRETLGGVITIIKDVDELAKLVKIKQKKPMEYYLDGKAYLQEKKWLEAKAHFLAYRASVTSGTRVQKDDDDLDGVRPPASDSHLKYLVAIQDTLNSEISSSDPLLSAVRGNIYRPLYLAWQKKYCTSS